MKLFAPSEIITNVFRTEERMSGLLTHQCHLRAACTYQRWIRASFTYRLMEIESICGTQHTNQRQTYTTPHPLNNHIDLSLECAPNIHKLTNYSMFDPPCTNPVKYSQDSSPLASSTRSLYIPAMDSCVIHVQTHGN